MTTLRKPEEPYDARVARLSQFALEQLSRLLREKVKLDTPHFGKVHVVVEFDGSLKQIRVIDETTTR